MSSLIGNSPTQVPNLRNKVSHVKHLLDDANRRLQDEASKYEIFTTKTSAKQNGTTLKQGANAVQVADLRRTISDIGTIQSVLSCPIFNRIVNVTDSLDKLSYHLNLRPSIGPSDVNIDDNGELILAPPIEPTTLSNYINNHLDSAQYSIEHSNSPQLMADKHMDEFDGTNGNQPYHNHNDQSMNIIDQNQFQQQQPSQEIVNSKTSHDKQRRDRKQSNDFRNSERDEDRETKQQSTPIPSQHKMKVDFDNTENLVPESNPFEINDTQQQQQNFIKSTNQVSQARSVYDTEKLVTNNGHKTSVNIKKRESIDSPKSSGSEFGPERSTTRVKTVAAVFENAINGSENRSGNKNRLHKANGQTNQMTVSSPPVSSLKIHESSSSTSTNQQPKTIADDVSSSTRDRLQQPDGPPQSYSNDLYQGTKSSFGANGESNSLYANGNMRKQQTDGAIASSAATRVSPSASADSTVKLADDCDSGTSSFRSQAVKGSLYSPQSHKPIAQLDEYSNVDSSIDQELIEKLSPEMERIKVTLEKGPEGIGIIIAGYTCDQEEISGIFIKGITPGSPADRCGKIRILDQIFAINGQELLGYSNPEATNLLRRHTGKVVTLELMRYLAESRYQRLQKSLDNAARTTLLKKSQTEPAGSNANSQSNESKSSGSLAEQTSSMPTTSNDPPASARFVTPEQAIVSDIRQPESTHKSSLGHGIAYVHKAKATDQPMPVAARRYSGSTNKVIETKQGARNTIDIRSPLISQQQQQQHQTTATAMYVNKSGLDSNLDGGCTRSRQEAPEEFTRGSEPEWESGVEIVELRRDLSSQGLGFTVKEYNDPKDQRQSIIMITSITPGGIAEIDGKLSLGDLLVFVDDKSLEGASLNEAVKALKETNGQVRLGVLKLKR